MTALDWLIMAGPVLMVAFGAAIAQPALRGNGADKGRGALFGVIALIVVPVAVAIAITNLMLLYRRGQSIAKRAG